VTTRRPAVGARFFTYPRLAPQRLPTAFRGAAGPPAPAAVAMLLLLAACWLATWAAGARVTHNGTATPTTSFSPRWSAGLATARAVPTHQDAISNAFDPRSPLSKPAYARMAQLGAHNVRYLHWTAAGAPLPEAVEGQWDSAACDEYVSSFMAAPNAQTAVVNFNWPSWLHSGNSSRNELRDLTGAELGRWLSKTVSWYTKGGFDAKHRSPYRRTATRGSTTKYSTSLTTRWGTGPAPLAVGEVATAPPAPGCIRASSTVWRRCSGQITRSCSCTRCQTIGDRLWTGIETPLQRNDFSFK
jgi:hypothetical protein